MTASLLIHLVAFSALAVRQRLEPRVRTAGSQKSLRLEMALEAAWSNPTQSFELDTPQKPTVVIQPTHARVARRRFVQVLEAQELLSPAEPNHIKPTSSLARATPSTPPSLEPPPSRPERRNHLTPIARNTVSSVVLPGAHVPSATAVDLTGNPPPAYPIDAQRRRWQGTVLLRLFINAEGTVTRVELARSSGYDVLDHAAVTAVRQWKATPATRAGKTVSSVEVLPVQFQL